ncbi:hypothetical protein SAMN06296378_1861 [Salinibacterium xinjiangense]|uniref:Uncharacterized protein n=1 Tax=Salinibacterium xinjiangense TaxID=386302 RepID=A0A2C8ZTP8_9MICO|nr:hypothetical protein SAMN06296378_1861 [Salinibacterium xinjiangense]
MIAVDPVQSLAPILQAATEFVEISVPISLGPYETEVAQRN